MGRKGKWAEVAQAAFPVFLRGHRVQTTDVIIRCEFHFVPWELCGLEPSSAPIWTWRLVRQRQGEDPWAVVGSSVLVPR